MPMKHYLSATDIINWKHNDIIRLAAQLTHGVSDTIRQARRCFEWVRDEIRHSHDHQCNPVTCIASDVLREKTGYCYAKSHLLAALLRANGIPAGLCYQRLSRDGNGAPFCLHGLNAVYLPDLGWYRIDPRGNTESVDARFDPPTEHLAFVPSAGGETDIRIVFTDPLPIVVQALQTNQDWQAMHDHLPDLDVINV